MLPLAEYNNLEVDSDSLVELAKSAYDHPESKTIEEFVEDYSRFRYVKRLLNRYSQTGESKSRLILNHLILIFNVFEIETAKKILYSNNEVCVHRALTSFLYFMNLSGADVDTIDPKILEELNSL